MIDCYSPSKVVRAREYQEEKEALKAQEEEAKLHRKIQQEVNRKIKAKEREEKEAKAAARQLAKDLQDANPKPPKAPRKKAITLGTMPKRTTTKMSEVPKAFLRVRSTSKLVVEPQMQDSGVYKVGGVVPAGQTRSRTIRLPQRYI